MTNQALQRPTLSHKSGFDKWKNTIDTAIKDSAWNKWDDEIYRAVNEFNLHLSKTPNYKNLDWQYIKAMVWVETGAESKQWNIKPIQIGVPGDAGLPDLLLNKSPNKEDYELIVPKSWRSQLTKISVTTMPIHNIRAGIAYLLKRLAKFEYQTISDADTNIYQVTVKSGDTLEKIAKKKNTTIDVLRTLNPDIDERKLKLGQILKYQKASRRRVISGWQNISTAVIASRYNGNRDKKYAEKLDYVLKHLRRNG